MSRTQPRHRRSILVVSTFFDSVTRCFVTSSFSFLASINPVPSPSPSQNARQAARHRTHIYEPTLPLEKAPRQLQRDATFTDIDLGQIPDHPHDGLRRACPGVRDRPLLQPQPSLHHLPDVGRLQDAKTRASFVEASDGLLFSGRYPDAGRVPPGGAGETAKGMRYGIFSQEEDGGLRWSLLRSTKPYDMSAMVTCLHRALWKRTTSMREGRWSDSRSDGNEAFEELGSLTKSEVAI